MNDAYKLFYLQKAFGIRGTINIVFHKISHRLFRQLDEHIERIYVRKLGRYVYYRPNTSDFVLLQEFFFNNGNDLQYDIDFEKMLDGKPKYILDAGANIGLFSLTCLKYNPKLVIAIEPEKTNYDLLCKNVAQESSVRTLMNGIWKKKSFLKIIPSDMGKWGFMVKEALDEGDSDVIGLSIIDIMQKYSLPYIDILKMDIEGSEYNIFTDDSCEEWINKVRILVVETHDRKIKGCTEAVLNRMRRNGFSYYIHGEDYVFVR